ncbi:MAG: DUF429 domain-containing protein [bacterium]|nr:DUF429 domain-containing protein [bacterium]
MVQSVNRALAIDWSGDRKVGHLKIWLCEVANGQVWRLERGRRREAIASYLIEEADYNPGLVVGLDFAFSFPAAFLEKRKHKGVGTVWKEAEQRGEDWLTHCPFPFWGKPGTTKPSKGTPLLRGTDLAVAEEVGRTPKSVFQIGGPGAVGVGSLRGMPMLRELREAGFSIWPFDPPRLPLVVEIWPRVFMGGVKKSRRDERTRFLDEFCPGVKGSRRSAAEASDDAFDALVSALAMDRHREEFEQLVRAKNPITRLEGEIWRPGL